MQAEVYIDVRGKVAELVFNHPTKPNAVTPQMASRLDELAGRSIGTRRFVSCCCVVPATAPSAPQRHRRRAGVSAPLDLRNRVEYATAIRNLRKPVIAVLHD